MSLIGARKALLFGRRTGWVLKGDGVRADIDLDFANGRGWQGRLASPASLMTCTRAISGTGHTYDYADDSNGNWLQFLAGVPRITNNGLLVEEARTNVVLYSRDLTNAAWNTKTNITVALNQTGIDGTTNSASSITATNSNAIISQGITLSSSARFQSAFVKRLTGSGTVSMTMDGGSTWVDITLTSSWSRVTIPTQTLANPTVGFKIATSGDAIAVDAVQNENGAFSTSPIFTTSATITRNADVVSLVTPVAIAAGAPFTLYGKAASNSPSATAIILNINNSSTDYGYVYYNGSAQRAGAKTAANNVTQYNASISGANTWLVNAVQGVAFTSAPGDQAGTTNGLSVITGSAANNPALTINNCNIGSSNSINYLNGYIKRVAIFTTRVSNSELQRITLV